MDIAKETKDESLHVESVILGDLTWIYIERPTDSDIAYLKQNYRFHPLDLDDCLSQTQRPKLDIYKDYLFLIFHYSVWDKVRRVSSAEQVAVFVGDNYVITLHSGRFTPLVSMFRQCQRDEEARRENLGNGSGYLMYRIVDRAVDSYFPILDKILSLMNNIEESVFDESVEAAKEVFILRRDIITQRRIMFPDRIAFSELETKLARFSKVDLTTHFGDVMDHMNKICETLDECKEIIDAFKDTDYVLSTNRIKRYMRIITIFGSIALPFIAISGIYAMNVVLPGGTDNVNFRIFIILTAVICFASGSLLYFLHRKRFI